MSEIVLSKQEVKALLSETKMTVLKTLKERRMTVSELSEKMGLSKSNLFQHLKELLDANLIRKVDDERKWVYYELSFKGDEVVSEKGDKKFVLLLSFVGFLLLSFVGLLVVGAFFLFFFPPMFGPAVPTISHDEAPSVQKMGSTPEMVAAVPSAATNDNEFDVLDSGDISVITAGGTINDTSTTTSKELDVNADINSA